MITGRGRGGRRSLAVLAFVLLSPLATAIPAHGVENETFGLVPHPEHVDGSPRRTFSVPLEPGSVFEDAIRVYNRTDQPLEVIVYAADAEAGLDGTISVGFRGSRPTGVGGWIELAGDQLSLPPRGEALMQFRVHIRSSDPSPDLGAIAVEASGEGVAANLAERLHLVVRTTSPNSATTSVRVRPLLLRSPWIILAIIGLVVALTIVWLGARRSRRPKDAVVPTGQLRDGATEPETTPAASKPVLRRLGEAQPRPPSARKRQSAEVGSRRPRTARETEDDRPMLDELLSPLDDEAEALEEPEPASRPVKRRTTKGKTSARRRERKQDKPKRESGFIPLDDL